MKIHEFTKYSIVCGMRDRIQNIVRLLLDAGADIDKEDGDGDSPFLVASYGGHIDLVRLLMEAGADIHRT